MFNDLKQERETRRAENRIIENAVENEKRRLEEQRANQKKSVIRKISVIDKKYSEKERREDAAALEDFKEEAKQRVASQRAIRKRQIASRNKKSIALTIALILVVIAGGTLFGIKLYNDNLAEKYEAAVDSIMNYDYETAATSLGQLEYKDSATLLEYCNIQSDLDQYKGNSELLAEDLERVGTIENEEVKEQYAQACDEAGNLVSVQADIDKIKNSSITLDDSKDIKALSKDVDNIDERYSVVLDTDKLDTAEKTISNLKEKNSVGKLMIAISAIGKVKLSDKKTIKNLMAKYDKLSDSKKAEVVNYKVLEKAEAKVSDLDKKHKAKLAEEKEAEEEAKAAVAADSATVYYTPTGGCYHYKDCRTLNGSRTILETTRSKAKAKGLKPCSVCNPGA